MLALGCASIRELEARCTPFEIELWLEFLAVEPIGSNREDERFKTLILELNRILITEDRYRRKRKDILPTPYEVWEEEEYRKTDEYRYLKNQEVARNLARWLKVDLGEKPQWQ